MILSATPFASTEAQRRSLSRKASPACRVSTPFGGYHSSLFEKNDNLDFFLAQSEAIVNGWLNRRLQIRVGREFAGQRLMRCVNDFGRGGEEGGEEG